MTTIWRYMDLWKFKSILEKQALYFSRVAAQEDKLEGLDSLAAKIARAQQLTHLTSKQQSLALHNQEVWDDVSKNEIVLSCWHINDVENPRMWKEYLKEPEGVAIQTSDETLRESFKAFSHPHYLDIRPVRYINRTTDPDWSTHRIKRFFQKEPSFEWENELRVAIDMSTRPLPHDPDGEWNAVEKFDMAQQFPVVGLFVPVSVEMLIEQIIISPNASDIFVEEVRELCNTHKLRKPIMRSSIGP